MDTRPVSKHTSYCAPRRRRRRRPRVGPEPRPSVPKGRGARVLGWALGYWYKLTPSTHSHSMGLHQTRRFLTLTLFQWLMWGFALDYLYSGTCGWKLFSSMKFCSLLFCRLSAILIFLPFRVGFLAWKRRPQDPDNCAFPNGICKSSRA